MQLFHALLLQERGVSGSPKRLQAYATIESSYGVFLVFQLHGMVVP